MKHYVALFVLLFSVSTVAQQPAAPKAPVSPKAPTVAAPKPPAPPSDNPLPVNIRVDVSMRDQIGPSAPAGAPKTVTLMLADRHLNQVRTHFDDRQVDIDASPRIVDARIRLSLQVDISTAKAVVPFLTGRHNIVSMLESGKPMVVFEMTDPVSGKKMSIETTATIQK